MNAVNEAEQLKEKSTQEKLKFFEQLDARILLKILAKKQERDAKSKRRREDSVGTINSDVSPITDFQDDSPTRKKFKKDEDISTCKDSPGASSSGKTEKDPTRDTKAFEKTKDKSEPEAAVIPPYVPILDNENILPSRTRSGLNSDTSSDIISKVSSEKSDDSDPFSIKIQNSLFKRNNLFKGVSKEKVCQYCYQSDLVFKCTTGGCNGLYHLNCSVAVLSGEEYSKKKNKSKFIIPLLYVIISIFF